MLAKWEKSWYEKNCKELLKHLQHRPELSDSRSCRDWLQDGKRSVVQIDLHLHQAANFKTAVRYNELGLKSPCTSCNSVSCCVCHLSEAWLGHVGTEGLKKSRQRHIYKSDSWGVTSRHHDQRAITRGLSIALLSSRGHAVPSSMPGKQAWNHLHSLHAVRISHHCHEQLSAARMYHSPLHPHPVCESQLIQDWLMWSQAKDDARSILTLRQQLMSCIGWEVS